MTITELVTQIDTRLGHAQAEISRLTDAKRALLDGASGGSKPATRKPRAKRQARSNVARRVVVAPAGQLEKLLEENPGTTTTAIARLAGADRNQVLTLLKELEAAGRVRRSGERNRTRWHRYTAEDQIAERAADLAASTKSQRPKPRAARTGIQRS